MAHRRGVPVLVDAAAALPPASNLRRFVEAGADRWPSPEARPWAGRRPPDPGRPGPPDPFRGPAAPGHGRPPRHLDLAPPDRRGAPPRAPLARHRAGLQSGPGRDRGAPHRPAPLPRARPRRRPGPLAPAGAAHGRGAGRRPRPHRHLYRRRARGTPASSCSLDEGALRTTAVRVAAHLADGDPIVAVGQGGLEAGRISWGRCASRTARRRSSSPGCWRRSGSAERSPPAQM